MLSKKNSFDLTRALKGSQGTQRFTDHTLTNKRLQKLMSSRTLVCKSIPWRTALKCRVPKSMLRTSQVQLKHRFFFFLILLMLRLQGTSRSLLKKDKSRVCWIQLWAKHQTKVPVLALRLTKTVI